MRSAPRLNENIFGTLGTRSVVQSPPRCRGTCRVIAGNTLPPFLRRPSYPCGRPAEYHTRQATPAPLATGTLNGRLAPARLGTPSLGLRPFRARQHELSIKLSKLIVYIIYLLYFLHFDYATRGGSPDAEPTGCCLKFKRLRLTSLRASRNMLGCLQPAKQCEMAPHGPGSPGYCVRCWCCFAAAGAGR